MWNKKSRQKKTINEQAATHRDNGAGAAALTMNILVYIQLKSLFINEHNTCAYLFICSLISCCVDRIEIGASFHIRFCQVAPWSRSHALNGCETYYSFVEGHCHFSNCFRGCSEHKSSIFHSSLPLVYWLIECGFLPIAVRNICLQQQQQQKWIKPIEQRACTAVNMNNNNKSATATKGGRTKAVLCVHIIFTLELERKEGVKWEQREDLMIWWYLSGVNAMRRPSNVYHFEYLNVMNWCDCRKKSVHYRRVIVRRTFTRIFKV